MTAKVAERLETAKRARRAARWSLARRLASGESPSLAEISAAAPTDAEVEELEQLSNRVAELRACASARGMLDGLQRAIGAAQERVEAARAAEREARVALSSGRRTAALRENLAARQVERQVAEADLQRASKAHAEQNALARRFRHLLPDELRGRLMTLESEATRVRARVCRSRATLADTPGLLKRIRCELADVKRRLGPYLFSPTDERAQAIRRTEAALLRERARLEVVDEAALRTELAADEERLAELEASLAAAWAEAEAL